MGLCEQGPAMYPATVQCNGWLDLAQLPAHVPSVQERCFVTNTRNNIISQILSHVYSSLRLIQVYRDLCPFLVGIVPVYEAEEWVW